VRAIGCSGVARGSAEGMALEGKGSRAAGSVEERCCRARGGQRHETASRGHGGLAKVAMEEDEVETAREVTIAGIDVVVWGTNQPISPPD